MELNGSAHLSAIQIAMRVALQILLMGCCMESCTLRPGLDDIRPFLCHPPSFAFLVTFLEVCIHDSMMLTLRMAGSLPGIQGRLKLRARRFQAFGGQSWICDALAGFQCSADAGQKPTLAGALPQELGSTTTAPALTSSWLRSPASNPMTMAVILLSMGSQRLLQPHSPRQPTRLQAKLRPARLAGEMQRVQLRPTKGGATSQPLTYGPMCTAPIMRQQLQTLKGPCRSRLSHLPSPPASPSQACSLCIPI